MADGADLPEIVSDGEEFCGAGKQLAAEIGAQAVAEHRDAEPVCDACELPDLLLRQELRFIDEDGVDRFLPVFAIDPCVEVVGFRIRQGVRTDADA